MNYRRHTLLLIIFATAVRIFIAVTTGLGNDEVYYRMYADPLQWNYFDHPPMVGWLIRLSTFNLLIDTGLTIRMGAILCGAFTTWLLFLCAKRLLNAYAGFLSALLYTATIYGSIIAGTFILPDSPQMVCWSGALLLLIKITESKKITLKRAKDICWFGLVAGIGMLCKVHTIFLWIGFAMYIVLYSREWLRHWSVYIAALITLLFFLPVIVWNIQNDFITFFFHGKRVDVASGGLDIESFLTFIGGQIFYCNPVVFFIIVKALWHRDLYVKTAQKRMLFLVGLPLIGITSVVSFFKDLLPHWTGPAYASLILLSGCYFAGLKSVTQTRRIPVSFSIAGGLLLVIVLAGIGIINFYPGTFGEQKPEQRGETDFTLDMYGWKQFSKSFDSIYQSNHQTKSAGKTIILANKWFPAAHIDFYVARPLGIQTVAIGHIEDIHQYHWLNRQRGYITDSTAIYIISPSNYLVPAESFEMLKQTAPTKTDTIIQFRGGKEARRFTVSYFKRGLYKFNPAQY